MKNLYKILMLVTIGFWVINECYSQTYATPELKARVEKEDAERLKWIKKNPEEYRKQGGNPEQYILENTKQNIEYKTANKIIKYKSPVNIKDKSLFKIVDITAIDIENKHTEQEMLAFKQEAKGELDRFNMIIDFEKNTWYYIPRNKEKQPFSKNFNIENKKLQISNCKECEDNTFTIEEQTTNSFIVQLKPQDEGKYFVYQFTFKK